MSRRRSIINVYPIHLLLLLLAMAEAQPNLRWTLRKAEDKILEDSITRGIRNLENIRREITAGSLRDGENGDQPSSMNGRISDSEYSGYSPGRSGSRGNDTLTVGSTTVRQPRRRVDSAMYEALSKLANIQIADSGIRDFTRRASSRGAGAGRLASRPKFYDSVDEEGTKEDRASAELARPVKNEAGTQEASLTSSKLQFLPRKFSCRPIREIYIPKIDKKMPAYACSLGKRAFVISSERFIQDHRDHFEVNVDESTFRRLTPMNSAAARLTSGVSVLPATLVLKQGEDGYSIRGVNAGWKEVHATVNGNN